MKAFRRWLAKPVISIADGRLLATATITADALKLGWHLPWPAILAIVWGATITAFILTGAIKGLHR